MSDPRKALATQLANIEVRTGRTLVELKTLIGQSGLAKHGEIRGMLTKEFGLGFGDANTLAHIARQDADSGSAGGGQAVDGLYTGPKAELRPIHDKLMTQMQAFGEFEIAPKKTYLSLRRKKQFAMVGPATNTRVEVGLNLKGVPATERLVEMPPKSMCTHKVKLTRASEVDSELLAWLRRAYGEAG